MDVEAIETIRESSRSLLVSDRRKHRDEVADVGRSINNLRIEPETVTEISNKLKTKSAVSLSELQMLKNGLIGDVRNIEIVLHTHGALRGLVREMTGKDVNRQCAAAGCCCNLALGDSRACVAVAKAAGPYLVAALDNLTSELAVTSAWTLGNLAGSGTKACEVLMVQGAIAKLIDQLTSNNVEMKEAVLYSLEHFAFQMRDDFKPEHLHKILHILPSLETASSSHLLFILSCHSDITHEFITEDFLLKTLQYVTVSIGNAIDNPNIVYLFRFLANLNTEEVFTVVLNYFVSNNMVDVVKELLQINKLNESVMWFLGNAFKCCSDHVFFEVFLRLCK